ncbi:MAG: polysaccharide deacetylase family protein [Planctomycetia bacterium]|nr:polysaccharide deacetylase family protein [Planctomycetia bacterium]
MKIFRFVSVFLTLSLLITLTAFSSGEEMRRYQQTITVEFASADAAAEADLVPLELPVGKTLALASRWDDTTFAHLSMAKTLSENGWKGTFFLNKVNSDFVSKVVRPSVGMGCSVGVHTINHPHLETVAPDRLFYELLGNKILIEQATDLCANTFTFPFGLHSTPDSLSSTEVQGEAIRRTGLFGGAENLGKAKKMNLAPDQFISPYLFRADDKDPQLSVFSNGFNQGLRLLKKGPFDSGPCFILGVHSWQQNIHKDGFDRLSKILATRSHNPKYWYCNCSEYIAYRLAYLKNKVEKKEVRNNTAVFTLSCLYPADLGSDCPMGYKLSREPKTISVNGKSIPAADQGEFMLPNDPQFTVPVKIDCIENKENGDPRSNTLVSQKIPGIQFGSQIDWNKNRLAIHIENKSDKTLSDPYFTVRLPLRWKEGILYRSAKSIPAGQSLDLEIPLGEIDSNDAFSTGKLFAAVSCDFVQEKNILRLYSTLFIEKK